MPLAKTRFGIDRRHTQSYPWWMGGMIEIASAILAESQQRIDIAAQNIANMETPGYKRLIAFNTLLANVPEVGEQAQLVSTRTDFAQGAMISTGSALDLAISGPGLFVLRLGDQIIYSRQGSFIRDADGRLVRSDGYALQAASGGDLVLKPGSFSVATDGTVTQVGTGAASQSAAEVGRIALSRPDDPARLQRVTGGFAASAGVSMSDVAAPTVHQGMVEASNAGNGPEMVSIIEASRRAESGRQIIQVYDELLGRAFGVLGGGQ